MESCVKWINQKGKNYKKRNQLEKESGKKWINYKGKIVRKESIRKGKL